MKKCLSILMIFGALSTLADSYLTWMVDTSEGSGYGSFSEAAVGVRVRGITSNGDSYLNLYSADFTESDMDDGFGHEAITKDIVAGYAAAENMAFYASLASDVTYSSFVVEIYNGEGLIAQSSALTYADANAYIQYGGISAPKATVWMAGGYVVPEPNSALLVLLGCAALGLKRKKIKKGC